MRPGGRLVEIARDSMPIRAEQARKSDATRIVAQSIVDSVQLPSRRVRSNSEEFLGKGGVRTRQHIVGRLPNRRKPRTARCTPRMHRRPSGMSWCGQGREAVRRINQSLRTSCIIQASFGTSTSKRNRARGDRLLLQISRDFSPLKKIETAHARLIRGRRARSAPSTRQPHEPIEGNVGLF